MSNVKIIRMPALEEKVGLKKSAIYKRIKESDFPKPVRFGSHATGWLESDVDEWILRLAGKIPPANDGHNEHAA